MWKSSRVVVAVAGGENMDLTTADIGQAYTNASLAPGEKFYCELPRGYRDQYLDDEGKPMVAECGNLYGLPPAGRNWYKHITSTDPKTGLRGWGLEQSDDDPCVFTDADVGSYKEDITWVEVSLARPNTGLCWERAHKVKALALTNP